MSTKAFKSEKIDAMKEKFEKAQVAVVTEYKGYSVDEITTLRRNLQKEGGDYMVTKNTLAKIAAKGTNYEAIVDLCKGPIAVAFGFEDQVSPAKVVSKFIKDSKKVKSLVLYWKAIYCQQMKQKHWQIFLQKKNSTQKCSALSIPLHQVSLELSTQLWHLLRVLWQQLEIKKKKLQLS